MRLLVGLGVVAGFAAALFLDTQAVLQLAWMAATGRFGRWPQGVAGVLAALVAGRLVMAMRRRRLRAAEARRTPARRGAGPAASRATQAKPRVPGKGAARTVAVKARAAPASAPAPTRPRPPPRPRKG